jgi:type IV pilus assembly protein PilF
MLDKYNENRRRPTPRGLWLGVRLEHQLGNKDAEASQGLALRNLFPNSRENQEYQNWLNDEKHR